MTSFDVLNDIPEKLFITGIDTDAGKSFATGYLAAKLAEKGVNCTTMKFVQTGNTGMSEDILVHRKLTGAGLTDEDRAGLTCPEIFTYPCSPELAARIDGREIDFRKINASVHELLNTYDTVLIEGAGGLMVPLKEDYLTIDYIAATGMPAVLVTNGKLGSINHTLLSLYALRQYGIELFGVIYNSYFDYDKIIAEDTRNFIRKTLDNDFPEAFFLEMGEIKGEIKIDE